MVRTDVSDERVASIIDYITTIPTPIPYSFPPTLSALVLCSQCFFSQLTTVSAFLGSRIFLPSEILQHVSSYTFHKAPHPKIRHIIKHVNKHNNILHAWIKHNKHANKHNNILHAWRWPYRPKHVVWNSDIFRCVGCLITSYTWRWPYRPKHVAWNSDNLPLQ
jgi:hypothetical protein